jgi:2'-5' RNA ligase
MKNFSQGLHDYKKAEYQLVLLPHSELRNRISSVRKEFAEKYKLSSGYSGGNAHMTLVKFTQLEMMEERIVSRLKTISMGFHPFKVELKDYGSYPSHSIFINITTKIAIHQLVREIKTAQRLMKHGETEPHFLQEPNFIIARKLLPWQYEQGWLEYSHRSFTARFIADNLLLLKRKEGERRWQVAGRFEFMNLPVATVQGALF